MTHLLLFVRLMPNKDIVEQSQYVARRVLDNDSKHVPLAALDLESPSTSLNITSSGRHDRPTGSKMKRINSITRMQDISVVGRNIFGFTSWQ